MRIFWHARGRSKLLAIILFFVLSAWEAAGLCRGGGHEPEPPRHQEALAGGVRVVGYFTWVIAVLIVFLVDLFLVVLAVGRRRWREVHPRSAS